MTIFQIDIAEDDNGTMLVTCPQLPLVLTYGATPEEVLDHAAEAIEVALASMIDDGEDIPRPDRRQGSVPVRLPLLTQLKLELYWALRDAGITRAELARRLDWNRESVDRLFRLDHQSRPEQLDAAFKALQHDVEIKTTRAA